MKKVIPLLFLLLLPAFAISQTKPFDWAAYELSYPEEGQSSSIKGAINQAISTNNSAYPHTFGIRAIYNPLYSKVISKDFTRIAGGSFDSPGTSSYAFADIAKPSVSLGAAFAFKGHKRNFVGHFVSLGAKAGISENTVELFSNNKFSSTFAGQLTFSHLLHFDLRVHINDAQFQPHADSIITKNLLMTDSIDLLISREEEKLESIKYALFTHDPTVFLNLFPPMHIDNAMDIYLNRLRILSDETIAKLEQLRKKREITSNLDYKAKAIETYQNFKRKYIWLSHGVTASNTEFRLYNPNENPLLNNFSKASFLSWNIGARINHLSESNVNNGDNFFMYGEVSIGRADNLSELSKFNYKKDHTIKDADTTKSISETFEVYRNRNAKDYKQFHYLKFAYYHLHFLSKKRMVGITGYFSEASRFYTTQSPMHGIIDVGTGVFISVPNKKKGEAVVNMELYTRFSDILNCNQIRDSKFYDRNLVAIKIGVPFQIVAH